MNVCSEVALIILLAALASVPLDREPDLVELALKNRCSVEVPRDADMAYAGDLWRVRYDEHLSAEKVKCIKAWAKQFPKINAILPEPRSRYDRNTKTLRH